MLEPSGIESLLRPLQEAVDRAVGDDSPSILYSGGLDSSLLAHLARVRRPHLVTIGRPGSHDLDAARSGAAVLELPLTVREVSLGDIATARDRWVEPGRSTDPNGRAVAIGLALAVEAAGSTRVLCGQGADELFLGYAHFGGLGAAAASERRQLDLDRLVHVDWPLATRIAREQGRAIHAPYLDPAFRDAVLGTAIDLHLPTSDRRKPVLRELARAAGLPPELADRPKKAFQFGSGISRALHTMERSSAGSARPTGR